jgi:cytochrome c biogenesis protein CcmG/thiol:disulfide interchange protein DsbE
VSKGGWGGFGSAGPTPPTRRHFLCCTLGAVAATLGLRATAEPAVKAGDRPKTVTLGDLTGAQVALPDAFGGKVVVVHFWTSWCPSCLREIEALESLCGEFRERGFAPVSVNVGETKAAAMEALRTRKVTYPILLDTDSATARLYGVRGVPTTFVVDRAGTIGVKVLGEIDRKGLRKVLAGML